MYIGKLVRAGHSGAGLPVAVAVQDDDKERRMVEVIRVTAQRQSGLEAAGSDAGEGMKDGAL